MINSITHVHQLKNNNQILPGLNVLLQPGNYLLRPGVQYARIFCDISGNVQFNCNDCTIDTQQITVSLDDEIILLLENNNFTVRKVGEVATPPAQTGPITSTYISSSSSNGMVNGVHDLTVTSNSGDGTGFQARVTVINSMTIDSVEIVAGGTGYAVNDTLECSIANNDETIQLTVNGIS